MSWSIRAEKESEHRETEHVTREAFWNLFVPGCDEHFLVHTLRKHEDFIKELHFVAALKERIIGHIMYARSYVLDASGDRLDTITFGPISVLPQFQKQGIGGALIQHSIQAALESGYKAVIIQGHPHDYCKHGFKSSKDFHISDSDGRYPFSLLALELEEGIFAGKSWQYFSSDVYHVNQQDVDVFDKYFPKKEKAYRYTQEVFSIASRAYLDP